MNVRIKAGGTVHARIGSSMRTLCGVRGRTIGGTPRFLETSSDVVCRRCRTMIAKQRRVSRNMAAIDRANADDPRVKVLIRNLPITLGNARALLEALNDADPLRQWQRSMRKAMADEPPVAEPEGEEMEHDPCADALDKLWSDIILAQRPDYGEWEYPGQAYRHILAEFNDLRARLTELEAREVTAEMVESAWHDWVLNPKGKLHPHMAYCINAAFRSNPKEATDDR